MSLLKVDNIHVYYGAIHAIKGISFEVNEGEIVTLIGANGAGKSIPCDTSLWAFMPSRPAGLTSSTTMSTANTNASPSSAVSYTHLDVYKRQAGHLFVFRGRFVHDRPSGPPAGRGRCQPQDRGPHENRLLREMCIRDRA